MRVHRIVYGRSVGGSPWLTLLMQNGDRIAVDPLNQKLLRDGHRVVLTQNLEIPASEYKTKFGSIVRGHLVEDGTVVRIVLDAAAEARAERWIEREEPADRYYG